MNADAARNVCYVQDIVVYLSRKERHPALYVNIGARYFNDGIGKDYRQSIDTLIQLGELEVNECYREGTDDKRGFTKSYRIPSAAWANGITSADFRTKRLRKLSDHSSATGAIVDYVKKCYTQLTVRNHSPVNTLRAQAIAGLHKVASGAANVVYGVAVNRLYHSIVEMPSEGRVYIEHKEGKPLAEFDIKSCHPYLLVSLCEDASEKARYIQFLQSCDIYTHVANAMGVKSSRDVVKEDFMRFYNGGIGNYVYRYYLQHFPKLAACVMARGKDMAIYLQNLEARIMVETVGAECAKLGLFFIPMHDGWLGFVEQGTAIARILIEACRRIVGAIPSVTSKALRWNANKEQIQVNEYNNSLSLSSSSLSYVQDKNIEHSVTCSVRRWFRELSAGVRYAGLARLAAMYESG
jgi:phosphotransferase system IIB component